MVSVSCCSSRANGAYSWQGRADCVSNCGPSFAEDAATARTRFIDCGDRSGTLTVEVARFGVLRFRGRSDEKAQPTTFGCALKFVNDLRVQRRSTLDAELRARLQRRVALRAGGWAQRRTALIAELGIGNHRGAAFGASVRLGLRRRWLGG